MKRDTLQLSKDKYDLLIIGGGIHGACIAWDATLRGLSVALIERGDLGQGTSANSLKTIHGGLRYLQDVDLKLVRRMIHERTSYLRIAPHLVHPIPVLTPTYSRFMKSKMVMSVALKLNDLTGYDRNRIVDPEKYIPPSRLVSRKECFEILPDLPESGVTGGALWFDGQVYDTERLTLSFVQSAVKSGASVSNYVEGVGFLMRGNRVMGVKARDVLSGETFDIRARVVVNAAGPWVDHVLEGMKPLSSGKKFHHTLAMNIITRKIIDGYAAGIPSWPGTGSTPDGDEMKSHMLFVSPWRDYSLIGTFHSHYQGNPDQFKVKEEHLQKILVEVNSAYPGADLEGEDVTFIHYGFLAEKKDSSRREVKLVRQGQVFDHRTEDSIEGLITVVGVKYTTARYVAEKAVDLVFNHLEKKPPNCKTDFTPLHDGQIESFDDLLSRAKKEDACKLNPMVIDHLVRNYGSNYGQVRGLIENGEANVPLGLGSPQVLRAQVLHAVHEEMALKLSDVILRRTGLGSAGKPETPNLLRCADFMADELDWDDNKKTKEINEVEAKYNFLGLGERN